MRDLSSVEKVLIHLQKHPETKRLDLTFVEWRDLRLDFLTNRYGPIDRTDLYMGSPVIGEFLGEIFGVPAFLAEEDPFLRMAREYVEANG